MKRLFLTLAGLILLLSAFPQQVQRKSRKEIRAQKEAVIAHKVDSLINTGDYTFIARSANPMGWTTIHLTSHYDLSLKNDSVNVHLPYYGRAYRVSFQWNEGGIQLNEPFEEYNVDLKKGIYTISFIAANQNDRYRFSLSVSRSGYATLSVNSNNRQVISYYGILDGIEL